MAVSMPHEARVELAAIFRVVDIQYFLFASTEGHSWTIIDSATFFFRNGPDVNVRIFTANRNQLIIIPGKAGNTVEILMLESRISHKLYFAGIFLISSWNVVNNWWFAELETEQLSASLIKSRDACADI